jgi:hypothetical protein
MSVFDFVQLLETANAATKDVGLLRAKVDRKTKVEEINATVQESFISKYVHSMDLVERDLRLFLCAQELSVNNLRKFCFACGIFKISFLNGMHFFMACPFSNGLIFRQSVN